MKRLNFYEVTPNEWDIINKKTGDKLGSIWYNKDWKKYVWEMHGSYFDESCTQEVVDFLRELDNEK